MKPSRTLILGGALAFVFPSAQALAGDGWGASYSFGPSKSRITYARTQMQPGRFPPISSTSGTGPLFLWPGMSNGTSDLIQTTLEAWPSNAWCGANVGTQWCVRASLFGSFGQLDGAAAAIDYNDLVTIEYKLEPDNNTWDQVVTSKKLGTVVSTYSYASGLLDKTGFGFGIEADANSYTIDKCYYVNTELHFAAADTSFGSTGVGAIGAKYGGTGTGSGIGTATNVRTPDGGLSWLVDLITLPAMNPSGTQTSAPALSSYRPTMVTPYLQVAGGSWQNACAITVSSGTSVNLGPQPTSGGSWKWFGEASGTTRQITVKPTTSGTHTYVAQYTNSNGVFSSQLFRVIVP